MKLTNSSKHSRDFYAWQKHTLVFFVFLNCLWHIGTKQTQATSCLIRWSIQRTEVFLIVINSLWILQNSYLFLQNDVYSLKYIVSGIFSYVQVTITIPRSQYADYILFPNHISHNISYYGDLWILYLLVYNKGGLWENMYLSPDDQIYFSYIFGSSSTVSGLIAPQTLEFPKP